MSEHAVTIRQLDPLLRSSRQWGGARLTVEGTSLLLLISNSEDHCGYVFFSIPIAGVHRICDDIKIVLVGDR